MDNSETTRPRLLVDVRPPLCSHLTEVAELIVITGVCWAIIGYLDRTHIPTPTPELNLRNSILIVWAVLVLLRFVLPIRRSRKRRITVTDDALRVRAPGLRGTTDTYPIEQILQVDRKRNDLHLILVGWDRPLVIPRVPRAKKVQQVIRAIRAEHQQQLQPMYYSPQRPMY